jgi:hypothetical protein
MIFLFIIMPNSKQKKIKDIKQIGFETKYNLLGFFDLLLKIDKRNNPKLYENNGNTNNPDKSE